MTNPLYDVQKLPATSQEAIREFDDRYLAMIGVAPPPTWTDLGELIPSDSPHVSYPVTSFGLRYQQFQGEQRFKTLGEKHFDVKTEEFQEGYEGALIEILGTTYGYKQWGLGPSRLLIAEARLRARSIVALLEDGENQPWGGADTPIDGADFFSATHLSDFSNAASTQWSNYQSAAKSVTNLTHLQGEVTAMQDVRDENGDKLGADPTHILVPTAKYEGLKTLLAQNMILDSTGVAGVTNPYLGKFTVVHVPELTDENDWYLVDSKLMASSGLPPWFSLRWMKPTNSGLALRYFGEESDFFKNTGRIKASSHVWYGFSLGFPHAIRKIVGA